jgi:hypothetical protein
MTASQTLKSTIESIGKLIANKVILIVLIAAIALPTGWLAIKAINLSHPAVVVNTADVKDIIISGVHNLSELATATTNTKSTIVVRQEKKIFGIPVGDTNLIYEGAGTIRAGIDLTHLQVLEQNDTEHRIKISLPSAYISEVNLDPNRSGILADYRHWFGSKAGADLYDQAQKKAIAAIKQEACANNILSAASKNAEKLIADILTKAGFESIQFETQPPDPNACSV